MKKEIIEGKRFEYTKGGERGDFWAGVDRCGRNSFEVFFTAGKEGPTPGQILTYTSFLERSSEVLKELQTQFEAFRNGLKSEEREIYVNALIEIDIVNVNQPLSECDIEMACSASNGRFIFRKSIWFLVGIRSGRITKFERT